MNTRGQASIRLILFAACGAVLAATLVACTDSASEPPPGKAVVETHGCAECHGTFGISINPRYPNLAGQKKDYLVNQLRSFRQADSGDPKFAEMARRYFGMMNAKAKNLSDETIDVLTTYYSSQSCSLTQRAKEPVAPKAAGTCVPCHGTDGISADSEIPNLAGQRREYIEIQLRAFRREGERGFGKNEDSGRFHPVMTPQAMKLQGTDIPELAEYYSHLSCK
ncbi:MAG: hypothetical protein COW30_08460 [Rhodospirillales bacterium CG15_BIG_FIL_POST_REV_8_21_14_020_66_15]|nr:MAG: hypothetical protein COW30_08460 [Rhodospirillales bacterium CG15_BIG_FIL_POST_REV_8_21_14_020_66_15]